jgi:hypothetical protein
VFPAHRPPVAAKPSLCLNPHIFDKAAEANRDFCSSFPLRRATRLSLKSSHELEEPRTSQMSRPNPFQRHEPPDDESERVPLATHTVEPDWLDERDLGEEPLPSYTEAVAQGASRQSAQRQAALANAELPPPFEQMAEERANRGSRFNSPLSTDKLQKMSFCLLLPMIIFVVGSIFRSFRNSMTLICSGINFVNIYSNPTPPTASPTTSSEDKEIFFLWIIIVGLIAYPFLFIFLIVKFPQLFGLPKNAQRGSSAQSRQAQRTKRICCSVCLGLSFLFVGVSVATPWGIVHLANSRLQQNFASYSSEDWVGNYVVLENTWNGSIGCLYSPMGIELGSIIFTEIPKGWALAINGSREGFDTITYTNATNLTPTTFNATCRKGNGTSNPCLFGGLVSQPVPNYSLQPHSSEPEYDVPINMTISPLNQSTSLNISSVETVGTSSQYYQGIGLNYPPLGTWFQDSSTLLQVLWSTSSSKACAGLRINLSKENEVLAWPVLGIIWEWWERWGQNGGCPWS